MQISFNRLRLCVQQLRALKKSYPKKAICLEITLSLLLVLGLFLSFSHVFETFAVEAEEDDSSPYTISTATSGDVSFGSLTPGSTSQVYTATNTVYTTTDCPNGYKLYLSAQDNETASRRLILTDDGTGTGDSSQYFSPGSGTISTEGVLALSSLSSGQWGFNNTGSTSSFAGVPILSAQSRIDSASAAAASSPTTITYGLAASLSVSSGKYSGTVLYTAIADSACAPYYVSFNINVPSGTDSTAYSGSMEDQEISRGKTSALTTNAYAWQYHTFLGWSTDSSTTADQFKNSFNNSTMFTDGQSVLNLTTAGDTITLYAVWEEDKYTVTLTNSAGTSILSSTSGAGDYAVGKTVTLTATKSNTTCINNPTWTVVSGGVTLSTSSGTSTSFTMPDNDVSIRVTSSRKTYRIYYYSNGGSGTMSYTTATCGVATSLRTNTFTRDGYNFLGWSSSSSATSATYTDGQSVTLTRTSALSLYAVWEVSIITIANATYLQDVEACPDTVTLEAEYYLKDKRDNQEYRVSRLADGNCWMTQNLRFNGKDNLGTGSTVDPADGNSDGIPVSNYTFPTVTTSSSGWGSSSSSSDQNRIYYSSSRKANNSNWAANGEEYGALYSYYAATMGTGSISIQATKGQNATASICPAGWHLPKAMESTSSTDFTNSNIKSWYSLMNAYKTQLGLGTPTNQAGSQLYWNSLSNNLVKIAAAPLYLLPAGSVNGSLNGEGSYGLYWTATAYANSAAFSLSFRDSNTYALSAPQSSSKFIGLSVRCVFERLTLSDFPTAASAKIYLQDTDTIQSIFDNSSTGEQGYFIDKRDNQVYRIGKLADGNLWMTQNLRFNGKDTLGTGSAVDPADGNSDGTPVSGYAFPTDTTSPSGWSVEYDDASYNQNMIYYSSSRKAQNSKWAANGEEYGALYSYYAATMGTGSTSVQTTKGQNATASICPVGWHLPKAMESTNSTDFQNSSIKSWYNLLNAYSTQLGLGTPGISTSSGLSSLSWGSLSNNLVKMAASPLYLLPSGYDGGGSLYEEGSTGYYWTSTTYSNRGAHYMRFTDSYTYAPDYDNKFLGLSVRCVWGD